MKSFQQKSKDISWWENKKNYLSQKDPVRFYLQWRSYSMAKKSKLLGDYNKHLEESKNSPNGKLYQSARRALKEGSLAEVIEIGEIARIRRANNEFVPAPLPYDPEGIEGNFWVSMYLEAEKNCRRLMADFESDIEEALL